jgi:hypothetical protein
VLDVVQWTTGRTGREAVRGIVKHPRLRLVGCFAWSAEKVGGDVGDLCGIERLGIEATDDIDALLALGPDCVVYSPYRPDFEHVIAILERGCNVVTTLYQLAGTGYGDDVAARVGDATARGNSSLYASGIYPGHVPMMALAATAVNSSVEQITMLESVEMSGYANEAMFRAMGIDRDPSDPEAVALTEQSCQSFRDQVVVMAHALGLELDEVRFSADFAVAPHDLDFGFMQIGRGNIAAIRGTIAGMVGGRSRIECRSVWKMGDDTEPNWPVEHGYTIDVAGDPSYRVRIEPADGWNGAASTAMPVVNAIPAVCAAPAGVVNLGELPLVIGSA